MPAVTQSAQDSGTSARHISYVIGESEVLVKNNPQIFFHSGRSYDIGTRVVLDSDFQADSTLTHLTIQVTQL